MEVGVALTSFVTVEELSDKIGRDVTSDPGAVLAVDGACAVCRTIAEQNFTSGTDTVTLDGTGTDVIVLDRVPVSKITSVTVAGTALEITDYALSKGMLIRLAGVWPLGRQNVTVKYNHGYGPIDIPNDVRKVALDIAAREVLQGVAAAETNGDVNIRYGVPAASDLTANELRILRKHRGR